MPIQLPKKEKSEQYSIRNFFNKVQDRISKSVIIPKYVDLAFHTRRASSVADEIKKYENPQIVVDTPSQVLQQPDEDLVVLPPDEKSNSMDAEDTKQT